MQNLVDLKRSLERYAGDQVQFHFATILSPFIKRCVGAPSVLHTFHSCRNLHSSWNRALLAGGFGTGTGWTGPERPLEIAPVVQSGMEPVMTEHAKRVQRLHFQRRFAPSSPEPGTPTHLLPKANAARDEIEEVSEERASGSASGSGSQQDLSANDLEKALEDVERRGVHVGGHVWAHSVPGNEAPHLEQPVLSTSFPRFHLDLYVPLTSSGTVVPAVLILPLRSQHIRCLSCSRQG